MTVLASDNFTRANNADLGTNWDECTGESNANGFNISGNTAVPDGLLNDESETNNAATWPNNQYSQVTHSATSSDGVGAGAGPTCRAATGATRTYYRLVGNSSGWEIGKKVTGTFTSLASGSGTTFTAADTNRLTLNGTTYSASKNGGADYSSGTDSSIASGRAGIGHSSSSITVALSAWEGGDVGAAAVFNAVPNLYNYYRMIRANG